MRKRVKPKRGQQWAEDALNEIATWIDKRTTDSDWTETDAREMDWAIRHLAAEWALAKRTFAMKPEWFTVSVREAAPSQTPAKRATGSL